MIIKMEIEIADEKVAQQLEVVMNVLGQWRNSITAPTTRKKRKTEESIIGPPEYAQELNVEMAKQDAVDEAREAVTKPNGLTLDDVRTAVLRYSEKFGLGRALLEVNEIIGCRIEEIGTSQEALAEAIDKIDAIVNFDDQPSGTKEDVMAAFKEYAAEFDPDCELQNAKYTIEDGPNILIGLFPGVVRISQIPDDPRSYGLAATAIRDAIKTDRFNRRRA